MVSFKDTEIAFAGKSDKELNWAYRLFKLISSPSLVKFGDWFQKVAFALKFPIKGIIKRTIFRQFCGGETIEDCDSKIEYLSKYKIGAILDYSVEGMEKEDELDNVKNEIIATIVKAKSTDKIPFAVFKMSGICPVPLLEKVNAGKDELNQIDLENWHKAKQRFQEICQKGYELDVPIMVDAEDSWYQDVVDEIAEEMMEKYNKQKAIFYNTIQMYRHDRLEFLKRSLEKAYDKDYILGVKLVRGAYIEKEEMRAKEKGYPSPIQKDKESTDHDFNAAVQLMCQHIDRVWFCAGTHNEDSSAYLVQLMNRLNIDKTDKRIYFSQLLGMSDHISFNLAHEGYNVVKYVPYGPVKKVMPYLLRRVQENTSIAGQTGRELKLVLEEKNRRHLLKKKRVSEQFS